MKRCPQCNRIGTDEALKFCRIDGASLLGDSSAVNREAGTIQPGSTVSGETKTSILPNSSGANMNRVTTPTPTLPGRSLPVNASRVRKFKPEKNCSRNRRCGSVQLHGQESDCYLGRITVDPFEDPLRDYPRFKSLFKRMNLTV